MGYRFSVMLKDRLKAMRGKLGQKQMAERLGLPLPTYRKYELGKRHPNKLALAELTRRMEAVTQ